MTTIDRAQQVTYHLERLTRSDLDRLSVDDLLRLSNLLYHWEQLSRLRLDRRAGVRPTEQARF